MAHYVLTSPKVWIDGYDFSGDYNKLAINYEADEVENTSFGDDTHVFLPGLKRFDAQLEGAVNIGAALVEGISFGKVGTADVPVTIGLDTGADGETAYTMKALAVGYSPGATIGEIARFSVSIAASNERLVRGTIMHNATRTSTSDGTARQLGATLAGQSLYATLHVITVSGDDPTLDVVVASAASDSWPGAGRITFDEQSAIGAVFATPLAGEITDTWYRVQYTIGGTNTPTFEFIVIIGIV